MIDTTIDISSLGDMATGTLAELYQQLYGQECRTRHKAYLIRKIAWRIQANAEGDLSERARRRADELANDADVRVMPPKNMVLPENEKPVPRKTTDPRLPSPGSAIVRKYKGQTHRVVYLADGRGFEYQGNLYRTLSAVAKKITGNHINGFRFFNLGAKV